MTRFCFPLLSLVVLATLAIEPLGAQPNITAVENAASNIDPRLPNGGIAQGAVFVVTGNGLGPANISIAPSPFQATTLSNTSVAVTVGSTTVDAPMYYTSTTQVAALLPSNTPTGAGTVTVTYNNQKSASAPVNVVANNLAVFTIDSTGTGPAIITYPDYSLVSPFKVAGCGGPNTFCGAANPGDTLILWATGLGPISGGTDASGTGLGVNMPSIPLAVWVGGVKAQVGYQGRSGCCIGEDQIVFTIPNGAPAGCAVPLTVKVNNQVSNSTVIPIASSGRTCPDPTGIDITQLATLNTFTFGEVELDHLISNAGGGFVDTAGGFQVRVSGLPLVKRAFWSSFINTPPIGTCEVIGARAPTGLFFDNLVKSGYVTALDGGSTLTVVGPKGSLTVQAPPGNSATLSNSGAFITPGDYTVSSTGGKDVGAFTAHLTIQPTPTLTNPASTNGLTITRSQGMTVTWNPNGSTGHVEVVLSAFLDTKTAGQAICTAPASAGTLTIPPYVLLALPATNAADFSFEPGDQGVPAVLGLFSASGLTTGISQAFVDSVSFGGVTLK